MRTNVRIYKHTYVHTGRLELQAARDTRLRGAVGGSLLGPLGVRSVKPRANRPRRAGPIRLGLGLGAGLVSGLGSGRGVDLGLGLGAGLGLGFG